MLQGKYITLNPITHKRVVNRGEEDQYYIENHHKPIVPIEVFEKAQQILSKRSGNIETGRRKGNYIRKFTFSSRVYCGFCGSVHVRRTLYKNTSYSKTVWQCMSYAKKGKKDCSNSKAIREDLIENCFNDAFKLLYDNNKDIIKDFLNKVEGHINGSNISEFIKKLDVEKSILEGKLNKLLNLAIDGTIDEDIYKVKRIELNKKIKKIEKEQEQLKCQKDDEKMFDMGIEKIKSVFDIEKDCFEDFDKDVFEAIIHKVIIGEVDNTGKMNPYVIRFVIKNGFENSKMKMENYIKDKILNENNLILDFYSIQYFMNFEKQSDGSLQKRLEKQIRVKVEINT